MKIKDAPQLKNFKKRKFSEINTTDEQNLLAKSTERKVKKMNSEITISETEKVIRWEKGYFCQDQSKSLVHLFKNLSKAEKDRNIVELTRKFLEEQPHFIIEVGSHRYLNFIDTRDGTKYTGSRKADDIIDFSKQN